MVWLIVIDSNVWIFAEDDTTKEHPVAVEKVSNIVKSGTFGINVVIVSEVFHALSRMLGPADASKRVTNIIEHPAAEWLEFRLSIMKGAISLATQNQLRINDALIAQQMLELNGSVLTDNTKDFKKVKGLKILRLK